MAKAVGFIGNMKGKVGNVVGFKVSQSNNGTSQGVRVYQPNINNPKSAAQAEQRAKYAPIFATYRALKSIIDRGNESKPYGNASRIAWLKKAFRTTEMAWYQRGALIDYPVGCPLTKGSLKSIPFYIQSDGLYIDAPSVEEGQIINTVGALSDALMNNYTFLKVGDQVTFITQIIPDGPLEFDIRSIIINDENPEFIQGFVGDQGRIVMQTDDAIVSGAIILSREGTHGEHLRSTSSLLIEANQLSEYPYRLSDKQAAIASYMNAAGDNSDWAEEVIQ